MTIYTKPFTVINLYGGPGSAKSTTAAGLFYRMKLQHMSVELVTEYAKDLVYSDRLERMLDQQEYIFAKQNYRLHRLRDKVEYVITDSPILLSAVYVDPTWYCVEEFKALVYKTCETYNTIDILLKRPEQFQQYGRLHNKEQSMQIDEAIEQVLQERAPLYLTVDVDDNTLDNIMNIIV